MYVIEHSQRQQIIDFTFLSLRLARNQPLPLVQGTSIGTLEELHR
jgi:hypothetical protein